MPVQTADRPSASFVSSPRMTVIDTFHGTPTIRLKSVKLVPSSIVISPRDTEPTVQVSEGNPPTGSPSSIPRPDQFSSLVDTDTPEAETPIYWHDYKQIWCDKSHSDQLKNEILKATAIPARYLSGWDNGSTSGTAFSQWYSHTTAGSSTNTITFTDNHLTWNNPTSGSYSSFTSVPPPSPEQLKVKAFIAKRAETLLRRVLNKPQTRTWEKFNYFDVASRSRPNVVYRISSKDIVVEFENGIPTRRLCVHAKEFDLPVADKMLAMKFYVECDEGEFLATAIVHQVARTYSRPQVRPIRLAVA